MLLDHEARQVRIALQQVELVARTLSRLFALLSQVRIVRMLAVAHLLPEGGLCEEKCLLRNAPLRGLARGGWFGGHVVVHLQSVRTLVRWCGAGVLRVVLVWFDGGI